MRQNREDHFRQKKNDEKNAARHLFPQNHERATNLETAEAIATVTTATSGPPSTLDADDLVTASVDPTGAT